MPELESPDAFLTTCAVELAVFELRPDYRALLLVGWRDDAGVTCRRWNWRQGRRTGLADETRAALFILDALAPITDLDLTAAADALAQALSALGSEIRVSRRLVDAP